jgi:ATP-binding cassette subfamily B multidrug efflux pump
MQRPEKKQGGGIGSLKTLLPFVRRHWLALAAGFAFMLVQNYGYMKVPGYFQKILDEITGSNRAGVIYGLLATAGLYAALTVLSLFLMRRLIIGVSRKIEYSLRGRIYDKILELDYSFFQAHETGDLVSRATNDLDNVRTLLGPGIMYIPNSLSMLVRLSPVLMATVTAVLVFVVSLIFIVLPRLRPLFQKIQEYTGAINSRVWQVVSGITTVKLYTMEEQEKKRFAALSGEFLRRNMAVVLRQEILWPAFVFVFAVTELAIILIGGREVIEGRMSLGQLLQFNVMITTLTFPVLSLGWIMSLIQQGISAMGRINTILDGPVEIRNDWSRPDDRELSFELKDLSFTYTGQEKPSLKHLSLRIPHGSFIGITGTIGSGKSTLVNILTGLLKPQRGMVFVNGTDIRDIDPSDLFRRIGIVSQSPFLFSRSIADNIGMGADGKRGEDGVREAARLAGLDQDIASFPDGYGQMVGERGITLSGGQKQRTAIARALMKDSPIVILDDSLSSVDARTESAIIGNLQTFCGGKTVIVVSHRISPLKDADVIFVLDEGSLVEQGSHADLVRHGGLYARLVRFQQMERGLSPAGTESEAAQ